VLDLVHKALHQMALAVEPFIILGRQFAPAAGWNNGYGSLLQHRLTKVIGIVAFIRNHILAGEAGNQVFRLGDIIALSTRQRKAQRITQRIDRHMDFGAEPTPAASEGLGGLSAVFLDAPAAQGWAHTMVLSISSDSMSGSLAKWVCICSQMPSSHQRAKRLYTAFQFPYSAGSKRHWAPLRAIHNTPSTKRRQVATFPIRMPEQVRKNASIFVHSSWGSLTVLMPPLYAYVNRT